MHGGLHRLMNLIIWNKTEQVLNLCITMSMPLKPSKCKRVRIKIIIILLFLVMYVLATYIVVENYVFIKDVKSMPTMKLEYVVVHLDLKGAPPKLSYLKSILPMLKAHGVNGLLIEYEDMFPYEGRLEILKSPHCYKKEELQSYLTSAVSAGFEIIPLIQTFGHLEFALKLKEFAHLREDPNFPDSICPSSPESLQLVHDMLEQVIHFHQMITKVKHIHVGCDEVFHLNNCSACQKRQLTKTQAMYSHTNFVIDTVHSLSPDSTVLIWDDMYRGVSAMDTIKMRFPKTEAVYWDYTENLSTVAHKNMYKYNLMFDNLWIATAFKGADGPTKILPSLETRFYNHLAWLRFLHSYSTLRNLYRIKGIILTGWSRYTHYKPLCELLPASIHSLIINLILIKQYSKGNVIEDMSHVSDYIDQYIRSNIMDSLNCLQLDGFPKKFDAKSCYYEESDLFGALRDLGGQRSNIRSIIKESTLKYLSDSSNSTNFKAEYEYVRRMKSHVNLCSQVIQELRTIERHVKEALSFYFENYVIEEYIETKIRSLKTTIKKIIELAKYNHFRFQVPGNNSIVLGSK